MNNTDSLGNKLPNSVLASSNDSIDDALSINSFLLACAVAKEKGSFVVYDKDLKQANITDLTGLTSIVSH